MKATPITRPSGWLGHAGIPRPALVRREHRSSSTDGLDCLLAIWIAQAMLDRRLPAVPAAGGRQGSRELPPSTGTF